MSQLVLSDASQCLNKQMRCCIIFYPAFSVFFPDSKTYPEEQKPKELHPELKESTTVIAEHATNGSLIPPGEKEIATENSATEGKTVKGKLYLIFMSQVKPAVLKIRVFFRLEFVSGYIKIEL
jgi:hypothetical protein